MVQKLYEERWDGLVVLGKKFNGKRKKNIEEEIVGIAC